MCTRLASRVARSRVCKQGLLFHITCMYQYVTVVRALFLRSNMLRCSTAFRTSRATADNNHSNSNNDKQKKRKHQNTCCITYIHTYIPGMIPGTGMWFQTSSSALAFCLICLLGSSSSWRTLPILCWLYVSCVATLRLTNSNRRPIYSLVLLCYFGQKPKTGTAAVRDVRLASRRAPGLNFLLGFSLYWYLIFVFGPNWPDIPVLGCFWSKWTRHNVLGCIIKPYLRGYILIRT